MLRYAQGSDSDGFDLTLLYYDAMGRHRPGGPSRRQGLEWANYWTPQPGWTIDVENAQSKARFRDGDTAGDRIPGAISRTAVLGLSVDDAGPWFGGLRLRHFGPRPLIEDDSVRSSGSTLVSVRLGWRAGKCLEVVTDVLNLTDRQVSDIDYVYESRLAGENDPVADIHTHPAGPRTVRLTLRWNLR